jgi:hypothetical protein
MDPMGCVEYLIFELADRGDNDRSSGSCKSSNNSDTSMYAEGSEVGRTTNNKGWRVGAVKFDAYLAPMKQATTSADAAGPATATTTTTTTTTTTVNPILSTRVESANQIDGPWRLLYEVGTHYWGVDFEVRPAAEDTRFIKFSQRIRPYLDMLVQINVIWGFGTNRYGDSQNLGWV